MIFLIDKDVSVLENKTHSGNNITKFYVLLMYIRTISKYLIHISNNNSTLSFTCIYVQLTQKTWKLGKFFKFPNASVSCFIFLLYMQQCSHYI